LPPPPAPASFPATPPVPASGVAGPPPVPPSAISTGPPATEHLRLRLPAHQLQRHLHGHAVRHRQLRRVWPRLPGLVQPGPARCCAGGRPAATATARS